MILIATHNWNTSNRWWRLITDCLFDYLDFMKVNAKFSRPTFPIVAVFIDASSPMKVCKQFCYVFLSQSFWYIKLLLKIPLRFYNNITDVVVYIYYTIPGIDAMEDWRWSSIILVKIVVHSKYNIMDAVV